MTLDNAGINRRVLIAHLSKQWKEIQEIRSTVRKQGERLDRLSREFYDAIKALEDEITKSNKVLAEKTTALIKHSSLSDDRAPPLL